MRRSETAYLQHLLDAILQVESYLLDVDEAAFLGDARTQDAVVRRLEIIGEARDVPAAALGRLVAYHLALAAYKKKDWPTALSLFQGLGDDPLARLYAERLRELIDKPPAGDWDGVFELKQK